MHWVTYPTLQVVSTLSAGAHSSHLVALKILRGEADALQKSAGVFGHNSTLQITSFSQVFTHRAENKPPYSCSHVKQVVGEAWDDILWSHGHVQASGQGGGPTSV